MSDWIEKVTQWLFDLVVKIIKAIWDFFVDIAIELFDLVLSVVASALKAIPVPDFMTAYSLGNLIGNMDQDILFFVGILQIPTALGFLATGFSVRMVRKVVTLFQW
jgi:hypothetical protein